MLKWMTEKSPYLMMICCVIGFLYPKLTQPLYDYLPAILFFLMFFTLLGIEQKTLLRLLFKYHIWRFAFVCSVFSSLLLTGLAYILGANQHLLIAIAAATATAPLFGSGALVKSVGFSPLQTMAHTIAATLLMPLVLLVIMTILADKSAQLDIQAYIEKLLIYIVGPIVLSILCRKILSDDFLLRIYPQVGSIAVLLVFSFPLYLMTPLRALFETNIKDAFLMAILGFALVYLMFVFGYFLYRKVGFEEALAAAMTCGSGNLLLTQTIAGDFLGKDFMPLVGAMQLPTYLMPLLVLLMIKHRKKCKLNNLSH